MITKNTEPEQVLKLGESCNQCGSCCSYGTGVLLDGDLERISHYLNISKSELKQKYLEEVEKFNTKRLRPKTIKKPYGRCVFLAGKTCQIHPVKPAECRVGSCGEHGQSLSIWFTLNYFVNSNDPESVRGWAQYLKTHPTIPGGELKDLVPDPGRLWKIMNYSEYNTNDKVKK